MAERRMLSSKIVCSDAFTELPWAVQSLYVQLVMEADDDGFLNNAKRIQNMLAVPKDSLSILIDKRFLLSFNNGIVVIKHWRVHNQIRKDRYNPTQYQDEFNMLDIKQDGSYTEKQKNEDGNHLATTWQPDGNQMATQDRLGKVSLVKDSLEEEETPNAEHSGSPSSNQIDYESIRNLYNEICVSFPKCTVLSDARKKAIKARMNSGRTVEDFETLFRKAEASEFLKGKNDQNWRANFDWLIKDGNFVKVLDGNYDNRSGGNTRKQTTYTREEVKPQWMREGYSSYMDYLKNAFPEIDGESIENDPDLMAQADAIRSKYAK